MARRKRSGRNGVPPGALEEPIYDVVGELQPCWSKTACGLGSGLSRKTCRGVGVDGANGRLRRVLGLATYSDRTFWPYGLFSGWRENGLYTHIPRVIGMATSPA